MDAYSRGFAQGDAIYIEIIRPKKVFGFYSYLYDEDGNRLPLTQTSWGYRILLPIGAQDKREKIVLTWKQSVSDRFGTVKIEIPVNQKSFPQTRWYNRVSSLSPLGPANAGGGESDPVSDDAEKNSSDEVASLEDRKGSHVEKKQGSENEGSEKVGEANAESHQEGEEESEQRLSNFMKKITLEKSLKNQVFERKGNDLITSRLSHPRNMHYVTSACFTSRLQIYYKYENGKKVEVNRRVVMHNGVDLRGRPGTPVYAIADGQVVMARSMHFEGNFTVIDHGLGVFSGYMHQSNLRVQVGQYVRAGERIGDVGNTGYSTGPHLHLALWIRGVPVDPLSLYSLPIRE
ncbi:MAG: M23 family metallopeptidase [Leptospiraceae bacterium]|nr:M23 family metallopeptidase [Leptospiraceae bacterium]